MNRSKVAMTKDDKRNGTPKEQHVQIKGDSERKKAIGPKTLNLEFYRNEIKSKPWGCKIEDMLKWRGDYEKLENNHSYIQWLFPTQECGFNAYVQPVQFYEAEEIRATPELQQRFLRAYRMMLDFYGMELKCEETGEIQESNNWRDRFTHLNRSTHNFQRISRILTALGIFGFDNYQSPWLMFMMQQKFIHQTLPDIPLDVLYSWIGTVNNETSRDLIAEQFQEFLDKWNAEGHQKPGPCCSKTCVPSKDENVEENIDKLHTKQSNQPENRNTTVDKRSDEGEYHPNQDYLEFDKNDNENLFQACKSNLRDTGSSEYSLPGSDAADATHAQNDKQVHITSIQDKQSVEKGVGDTYYRHELTSGSDAADTIIRKKIGDTYHRRELESGSDAADTIVEKGFGDTYHSRQLASGSDAADTIKNPVVDGAPQPDWRLIEQFGTSSKSTVSYACASGGGGDPVPNKQLERTRGGYCQSVVDRLKRTAPRTLLDRSLSWRGENDGDNYQYTGQYSQDDGLAFDNLNLKFYRNEIVSRPEGRKIEQILDMKGDRATIEENPAFFQWLFPTQQPSRSNRFVKPLQVNEAEAIRDTPELKDRFLRAYKMMLDFYGMELKNEATGEIQRNPSYYRERLIYLNRSPSDNPRITRILTSLGILGFEHYQLPWLRFLMRESFKDGTLAAIPAEVLQQHWVGALQKEEDQMNAVIYFTNLQDEKKQEI